VVLGAVVAGPTVLDGVVTPGLGVVAPVVGVVLAGEVPAAAPEVVPAVGRGVVPAVDDVFAAADDEDADLAAFELLEQPDAANARTIAIPSAHLRAEDLMSLSPLFSRRHGTRSRVSTDTVESCDP
jgi:hypothetical protein